MENSRGENWFWWCLMVISAICGLFFTKLYDSKIIGECIKKKKSFFAIISRQIILGLKYRIIPRHHSHFYCFKGFIASKIKCLIFSEDLKNFGLKRIMVLSLYRKVAMDPISLGGLCPEHLCTHVCTQVIWLLQHLGFANDWNFLVWHNMKIFLI